VRIIFIGLSVAFFVLVSPAWAGEATVPIDENTGCMQGPLAEFGRFVGNWNIETSSYSKEDNDWKPGASARWNFVCLGNGIAIQDFWLPADGSVGTNLRTYNSDTESWDIAWTVTGMKGFAHIQAKRDSNDNIVMHYKSPVPDPLQRITFFPPDANGWNWKLEISQDSGESWIEVYRIKASKRN